MEPTATNLPHGLMASAEIADGSSTLWDSRNVEVSQHWRNDGSFDCDAGFAMVNSRER